MLKSEARITIPSFVLYWILLGLLGWSVKIMDLLFVENWIIRSLAELPRIMLLSTISGLLGGFILGIGQQRVLRKLISKQLSDWWWKTLIGMALVAPGGMIIITTISWISFRIQGKIFLPESKSMSFSLYQINLFFGGIILGIFQWTSFRKVLTEKGWKETSLWILGSMASIGLGVIIGTIVSGIMLNNSAQFGPRFAVEQVVTGVIYGISSGLIVLILLGKITRAQTNSEVVS